MSTIKYHYLFLYLLICFQFLLGQGVVLEGKVKDINTRYEISGVNVYVEDQDIGTVTNVSGKFLLRIPRATDQTVIVFQHVGYDTLKRSVADLQINSNIFLTERIIPLPAIEVEATREKIEIEKDLPQTVTLYEARQFELKGFIDAGDLLRTDQSVQVEEEISGKKTVAIRAGNPDEVLVLYDGIKLNNLYDNVFNLALIDLDDVDRFEIIKGSNTAIFGPEAFSGVINIVPKVFRDYNIRFKQQFGSYDSGIWNAGINYGFNKLHLNYSIRKGGSTRNYSDFSSLALINKSEFHTASVLYDLSKNPTKQNSSLVSMLYLRSKLDYQDTRDNESILNYNQLLSAKFDGNLYKLSKMKLSVAYQWLDETDFLLTGVNLLERDIENRAIHLNFDKAIQYNYFEWHLAYQYQRGKLRFTDDRGSLGEPQLGLEKGTIRRDHHGVAFISKFKGPTGSDFVDFSDFDFSVRYDKVKDNQLAADLRDSSGGTDSTGIFGDNSWDALLWKFSTHLGGGLGKFAFDAFMNYGTNIKFPTLLQQISSPRLITNLPTDEAKLEPEINRSFDIGFKIIREIKNKVNVDGWQIEVSYFKNSYENKFRTYYIPGLPISFYDNVKTAGISGIEAKPTVFLLNKKLSVEVGISKYAISEKSAFPFKSDFKRTISLYFDHAGYSAQIFVFKESEQTGWIRQNSGVLSEIALPEYQNFDIHLSKMIEVYKAKLFLNGSIRNVLDTKFDIGGLALRDRRYYVTLGFQY
jgi:outer membrane cobalamin receptor